MKTTYRFKVIGNFFPDKIGLCFFVVVFFFCLHIAQKSAVSNTWLHCVFFQKTGKETTLSFTAPKTYCEHQSLSSLESWKQKQQQGDFLGPQLKEQVQVIYRKLLSWSPQKGKTLGMFSKAAARFQFRISLWQQVFNAYYFSLGKWWHLAKGCSPSVTTTLLSLFTAFCQIPVLHSCLFWGSGSLKIISFFQRWFLLNPLSPSGLSRN